jgi:adenylate cyclase
LLYGSPMYEIERKFLVKKPLEAILKKATSIRRTDISQVYLTKTGDWVQRVRQIFDHETGMTFYVFTSKFKINDLRCIEIENPISQKFYDSYVPVGLPVLMKTRYDILCCRKRWHVDQFHNPEFENLIMAEIELTNEDEKFESPSWLGREVTKVKKYKNFKMALTLKP